MEVTKDVYNQIDDLIEKVQEIGVSLWPWKEKR